MLEFTQSIWEQLHGGGSERRESNSGAPMKLQYYREEHKHHNQSSRAVFEETRAGGSRPLKAQGKELTERRKVGWRCGGGGGGGGERSKREIERGEGFLFYIEPKKERRGVWRKEAN